MMILGPIGFGVPWLLAALAAVPVLWWLMRALPPRPRVISFPGTVLLTGLTDPKQTASRTPWWLLAVRMAAFCAAILAFAAPVWRPVTEVDPGSALLIVIDAGATAAPEASTEIEFNVYLRFHGGEPRAGSVLRPRRVPMIGHRSGNPRHGTAYGPDYSPASRRCPVIVAAEPASSRTRPSSCASTRAVRSSADPVTAAAATKFSPKVTEEWSE